MGWKMQYKDKIWEKEGNLLEVVKKEGLEKKVFGAKINGVLSDLNVFPQDGSFVELLDWESEDGRSIYRHTSAHILAHAVKELFPEVKLGIGPAIEDGFYYDFYRSEPFSQEDLEKIEAKMREIIKQDLPIERIEVTRKEAERILKEMKEDFKLELLEEIPEGERISFYRQGNFIDLCRGPHLPSTSWVKSFKLLSVSGAYWRGNEKNPMFQRIYGTSFPSEEELKKYLEEREEAQRRDHRKLGRELEIFDTFEEAGPGLIFYPPKGAMLRLIIEEFERKEHLKRGYLPVITPHLMQAELWKRSGHWDNYRENMFFLQVEDKEYAVKPMNCPGHILIYNSKVRSYRDLPLRFFEMGTVYRYERSGVLYGLERARGFTQDDAHIFCTQEQLEDEIKGVLDFVFYMLDSFGLKDYVVTLSTKPEKYIGSDEIWEKATQALKNALESVGIDYRIAEGEGAFYGPKIDVGLKGLLGKMWQGPTIQVDFNLPERFDLTYDAPDGTKKRPVMIHRAILGSYERFIGILIEHYGGRFPLWLAPEQVRVLPISEKHNDYAEYVLRTLRDNEIRAEIDKDQAKLNYKLRKAIAEKVPYIFIVGDKEKEEGKVSVRIHNKDLGVFDLSYVIAKLLEEIKSKKVFSGGFE
ncbi:MAG: threonine--tRNA ligase [Dictyoglomus thermophilum]|uniref:Threonine--tRNA ligase n=1 Tax=Dictyoglomus thermophilum TaxID=14 RepID=A0A7V4DXB4_DICTH|nr:threonine--tRNA ligase [Dictyoglomus thermophilum]MCX7721422.1 threonine--tRNA ligase [Dictyoglomus thermophilum]TYT20971.1 threonine--tRNA ligase [Dictyoglomus thermophilum]